MPVVACGCAAQQPYGDLSSNVDLSLPGPTVNKNDINELLRRIDLSAIADPGDKMRECQFFLGLAEAEPDRTRFRWFITAYLNAVYSYFETSALRSSNAITTATGEQIADDSAMESLRAYVEVITNPKKPYHVKTTGLNPVIQRLYKVRAAATHHFPLSIMAAGPSLPEDFHFGNMRGEGEPILALCRDALSVVQTLD